MKKYCILILLLGCINLLSFSQKLPKKKTEREVIINFSDSLIRANVFIENKKVKLKDLAVYYWFKSGSINKNIGDFSGNLLNGEYIVFNNKNQMLCKGQFKKGLKVGVWKRWLPQGGLIEKQEWKNGLLNGKLFTFDKTGIILQILNYKNGLKQGKSIFFNNGNKVVVKYKKGKEVLPKEPKEKVEKPKTEKPIKEPKEPKITKEKSEKTPKVEKEKKVKPVKEKKVE